MEPTPTEIMETLSHCGPMVLPSIHDLIRETARGSDDFHHKRLYRHASNAINGYQVPAFPAMDRHYGLMLVRIAKQ